MIQANELRIGNYVVYEATTHIVCGINEGNEISSWWVKDGKPVIEYTKNTTGTWPNMPDPYVDSHYNYSPIPLTPEVLEKAGFKSVPTKQYPYCYEKEDGDLDPDWTFRIWWWRDDICIEPFGRDKGHIGIEYLHQLQNLYFAITGKELEINLSDK